MSDRLADEWWRTSNVATTNPTTSNETSNETRWGSDPPTNDGTRGYERGDGSRLSSDDGLELSVRRERIDRRLEQIRIETTRRNEDLGHCDRVD